MHALRTTPKQNFSFRMEITDPHKSLLKYIPQKGLVLDAGCGKFTHTNFLKKYINSQIIAVDKNSQKNKDEKNCFVTASIENLPFRAKSFEFIFCLTVLEFINDNRKVINEFHRVLRPKGRLLFTVPTSRSIFKWLRTLEILCGVYRYPEYNVKPYKYYTKSDILKITKDKFKIIDFHGYLYSFVPRLTSFLISLFKKSKN